MKWEDYKPLVQNTREIIVFPFFINALHGKPGVWIDVGCGDGDLTCYLSKYLDIKIVGVDKELTQQSQTECSIQSVHLVKADLTKNGIIDTGVIFDGAYSNCCFCHLNDDEFLEVLVDLYNSLKIGSELVFLVPSLEWARDMYSDVIYESSGISAVPRFSVKPRFPLPAWCISALGKCGVTFETKVKQYFRLPEWYVSALSKCGFNSVTFEQILIPNNPNLETRYLSKVGSSLFTVYRGTRSESVNNTEAIQKAFDISHENRKLEIQLFWQRSLFFWGFVAAALVGYLGALKENSPLTILFAVFGLVCSIVWSAGNRGSKYWQEYWENKVNLLQHYTTGNIFYDRRPTKPKFWSTYEGRRISVSKLTMALSDFTVFLWLILCSVAIFDSELIIARQNRLGALLLIGTLFYCLFFLWKSKSED